MICRRYAMELVLLSRDAREPQCGSGSKQMLREREYRRCRVTRCLRAIRRRCPQCGAGIDMFAASPDACVACARITALKDSAAHVARRTQGEKRVLSANHERGVHSPQRCCVMMRVRPRVQIARHAQGNAWSRCLLGGAAGGAAYG